MSFGLGVSFGRICRMEKTLTERARAWSDAFWEHGWEWEETENYLIHRAPDGRADMRVNKRCIDVVLKGVAR